MEENENETRNQYSGYCKKFNLIFNIFASIGIYFPNNDSVFKVCLKVIFLSFYNLFSIYFVAETVYCCYQQEIMEEKSLIDFFPVLINFALRLHLMINACKVTDVCNCLANNQPLYSSRRQIKGQIGMLLYFILNIASGIIISPGGFLTRSLNTCKIFNYHSSKIFLKFILIKNFIETSTSTVTFMLLVLIYQELGTLMSRLKTKILVLQSTVPSVSRQVDECIDILLKASKVAYRIDKAMSPPLFYLISLYIAQFMAIVKVFQPTGKSSLLRLLSSGTIINNIGCMYVMYVLASRIPERLAEIKHLIISSVVESSRSIASGNLQALSVLGMGQVLNEVTASFRVTAIKIFKDAFLIILCCLMIYTFDFALFKMIYQTQKSWNSSAVTIL